MKRPILTKFAAPLAMAILMAKADQAHAIAFQVDFPSTSLAELDPFYNDGNSSIFYGIPDGDIVSATMAGYYYDSDPLDPGTQGILNRGLPQNGGIPGWLAQYGLPPDAVGSTIHTFDKGLLTEGTVNASYLSFKMERPEDLVFADVTLEIKNLDGVGINKVWAGTSQNNFTIAQAPATTFSDDKGPAMVWTWHDVGYGGTNPFEVRVYGIIGADEGTWQSGVLYGRVTPPPVPEATSISLVAFGLMGTLLRRRR